MRFLFKKVIKKFSSIIIPDPNKISKDLGSLITAGLKFGEPIHIVHLGESSEQLKKGFENSYGHDLVESFTFSESESFDGKSYETTTKFLNHYLQDNSFNRIIMSNSFISKEVLPKLSIEYKCQAITDVIDIIDKNTFLRPIYAGNAISKVTYKHSPLFMSIRVTNFESFQGSECKATIQEVKADEYLKDFKTQVRVKENLIQKSERPDLTAAKFIFAGGRALKSKKKFDLLYNLSDRVKDSAVGASRAAVDAGYVSNDL